MCDYDFDDEMFDVVSQEAKDFIEKLLIMAPRYVRERKREKERERERERERKNVTIHICTYVCFTILCACIYNMCVCVCVCVCVCSVNLEGMLLHNLLYIILPTLKYTLVMKTALIVTNKLWNAISTNWEQTII